MRLRPYISARDYPYVEKWVKDERVHALWSGGRIPYPLTQTELQSVLEQGGIEWGACAFTATEDDGTPIGFFIYSVNTVENFGFLAFVVLDDEIRGRGYGTQMLHLALRYASEISGVSSVQIHVFDVNAGARKCYSKAGFEEQSYEENAFSYGEEHWGRYRLKKKL